MRDQSALFGSFSKKHFPCACPKSEQEVRAVTIRRVARILAAAKERKLRALGREHQGLDPGPGMRSVAKRLFLAASAPAPRVTLPGLELDLIRVQLRAFWLF
jgi:hypothetical protein